MSTFHPKHETHQEQSKKAQYVIKTDNTRQNTSQHNSIHISQKARNTTQQNIQQYPHLIRTQNIKKTQVIETENTRQTTTGTKQKS